MSAQAAPRINDKREIFGWYMYDWAISAFSTTVGTVFLGPYLAALARAAADASGMVYVLGVPIAPGSFLPYCISISVGMRVPVMAKGIFVCLLPHQNSWASHRWPVTAACLLHSKP